MKLELWSEAPSPGGQEPGGSEKATFSELFTLTAPGGSWEGARKLEKRVFQEAFLTPPKLWQKWSSRPWSLFVLSLWARRILLYLASRNEHAEHFILVIVFNH